MIAQSARSRRSLAKLYDINWLLVALVMLVGFIGVAMIYAATDGVWSRGAAQHFIRLSVACMLMIAIALVDVKLWYCLLYTSPSPRD